jgi:hypothetical protein
MNCGLCGVVLGWWVLVLKYRSWLSVSSWEKEQTAAVHMYTLAFYHQGKGENTNRK